MNGIARVRIGRVRMKNGGADVRVLPQETGGVDKTLRGALVEALERDPFDAFALICFRHRPETPADPGFAIWYNTVHEAFTEPVLARLASAYILTAIESIWHERRRDGVSTDWQPSA